MSTLAALALGACAGPSPTAGPAPDAIQVLVLGTYHFANPGLDVVNTAADDVLTDARQAELRELSRRLGAFRPTAIAVESRRRTDDALAQGYLDFTPGQLATARSETVQIGYRLAHDLGLDRVYAIDEQDGEIAFFPFDRVQSFAAAHDRIDAVHAMIAAVRAESDELARDQLATPIWALLARHNDPARIEDGHRRFYYGLLDFSTRTDHAGAALNYGWYARNALIFANLTEVVRPGDRIVVLYGAGHAYWLRHFVEETPGFALVDPLPFLRGEVSQP